MGGVCLSPPGATLFLGKIGCLGIVIHILIYLDPFLLFLSDVSNGKRG